jgi:hypothetical protein
MLLSGMIVIGLSAISSDSAFAQAGPNGAINPNRDCQTIRTCQFKRGGEFRGCISTYSCRRCRFVRSDCTITGERRTCRRLTCSWGS